MAKKVSSVLPHEQSVMLDIPGAARLLSTTPWGLRRAIYSGKIAYKKLGCRILIPRSELERFASADLRREKAA